MIEFNCIQGKHNKLFVKIQNLKTKEDFEIYETVKNVLYRKEYKPFLQSFNKNIEHSYIIRDYWFPVQFWPDVQKQIKSVYGYDLVLENEQIQYNQEITEETFQEFIDSLKIPKEISLDEERYKYQQICAFKAIQNKIGRIEVATSGGKTFITYLYCRYIYKNIKKPGQKILVIVPSTLLCKQLQSDFNEYQSLEDDKMIIETIFTGAKKVMNADIVCGTFQSLANYEQDYFDDFSFIICDELHRAKAYSIRTNIFNKIYNAEYWFGMSGTYPKYNTLDYLHIVSMFGPVLYTKSVKSLMDDGVATPVRIHIIKINYDDETKNFSKKLKEEGIVGTEKFKAEKLFFQTYKPRTDIIRKLLAKYTSNAIILVDTVEYCDTLKQYLSEYLKDRIIECIHYQVPDRDKIIESIKNTESGFILIGTYGTMSTGVSIKNLEQIYFVDGGKSDIRIRQSIGRGIRLNQNKEYCDIFDFYDNMPGSSFSNHARERISIYKDQKLNFKIHEVTI